MKRDLIVMGVVLSVIALIIGVSNFKTDRLLFYVSLLSSIGWGVCYYEIRFGIGSHER
jgi:hypothetical protein